jgi:hypothetical protein
VALSSATGPAEAKEAVRKVRSAKVKSAMRLMREGSQEIIDDQVV